MNLNFNDLSVDVLNFVKRNGFISREMVVDVEASSRANNLRYSFTLFLDNGQWSFPDCSDGNLSVFPYKVSATKELKGKRHESGLEIFEKIFPTVIERVEAQIKELSGGKLLAA